MLTIFKLPVYPSYVILLLPIIPNAFLFPTVGAVDPKFGLMFGKLKVRFIDF